MQVPTLGLTFSNLCRPSREPGNSLGGVRPGVSTWSRHRGFGNVGVPRPLLIIDRHTVAKGETKGWHLLWMMSQAGANPWSYF